MVWPVACLPWRQNETTGSRRGLRLPHGTDIPAPLTPESKTSLEYSRFRIGLWKASINQQKGHRIYATDSFLEGQLKWMCKPEAQNETVRRWQHTFEIRGITLSVIDEAEGALSELTREQPGAHYPGHQPGFYRKTNVVPHSKPTLAIKQDT